MKLYDISKPTNTSNYRRRRRKHILYYQQKQLSVIHATLQTHQLAYNGSWIFEHNTSYIYHNPLLMASVSVSEITCDAAASDSIITVRDALDDALDALDARDDDARDCVCDDVHALYAASAIVRDALYVADTLRDTVIAISDPCVSDIITCDALRDATIAADTLYGAAVTLRDVVIAAAAPYNTAIANAARDAAIALKSLGVAYRRIDTAAGATASSLQ